MDAPVDSLAAFSVEIESLRLVDADGERTDNLLDEPTTVELLGLQTSSTWLSSAGMPLGTYESAELQFDPASVSAMAMDGSSVPVTTNGSTLVAEFDSPLVVDDEEDYARLLLDVDLTESLSGDVDGMVFDATGSAELDDGSTDQPLDELHGLVTSFSFANRMMVLTAYADGDQEHELGSVTVELGESVRLRDHEGDTYESEADFFEDLVVGSSFLEIDGDLSANGIVIATKVEVEDHDSGSRSEDFKIEGIVLEVGDGSFQLLVVEIEKGEDLAQPVVPTEIAEHPLLGPSTGRF
jgi:hypothetical protein